MAITHPWGHYQPLTLPSSPCTSRPRHHCSSLREGSRLRRGTHQRAKGLHHHRHRHLRLQRDMDGLHLGRRRLGCEQAVLRVGLLHTGGVDHDLGPPAHSRTVQGNRGRVLRGKQLIPHRGGGEVKEDMMIPWRPETREERERSLTNHAHHPHHRWATTSSTAR